MPPKKDDKKGAAALTPEEKLVLAEQTMEAEKQNMQVDMAFHKDKLTQSKIEAANYHHELEDTKSKLAKALLERSRPRAVHITQVPMRMHACKRSRHVACESHGIACTCTMQHCH